MCHSVTNRRAYTCFFFHIVYYLGEIRAKGLVVKIYVLGFHIAEILLNLGKSEDIINRQF